MQNDVVLTMRGIDKYFPGTRALDHVDFTLRKGEVHALMGENGAGKSTLIKVLTGVYEKDAGSIWVEGSEGEAHIHSPQDAQNIGISTVYQEITLCPNLTVAENMFIGQAGAVPLLPGRAADGGHRPRGGHELQGADPGRAHLLPGRQGSGDAV